MGLCDTSNYDTSTNKKTTCYSGYDQQTGACCNRAMWIFWQVVMWVALFLACGLCIYCMVSRARKNAQRQNMYAQQMMQNGGQQNLRQPIVVNTNQYQPQPPIYQQQVQPYAVQVPVGPPIPQGVRPVVNQNLPTTKVKITLYNGQSVTLDMNLDHTVGDVYAYVESLGRPNFQLLAGRPPRPLTDRQITIQAANLGNSNIIQKLT